MEGLIDSFATTGGALLTSLGMLSLVMWVGSIVRSFVVEAQLRRWLLTNDRVRIDDDQRRQELLDAPSAASRAAMMLAGLGAVVLAVAAGGALTDSESVATSLGLAVAQALIFMSALLGALGHRREVTIRSLLRDRIVPGDLPATGLKSRRAVRHQR